jgi:hypothetical protein
MKINHLKYKYRLDRVLNNVVRMAYLNEKVDKESNIRCLLSID